MVKLLADQMVDLSRKVSKFISQHPREKISRAARHSSPHPSCRARPLHAPSGAMAQPHRKQRREATPLSSTLIIRIFGEKSSNIVQKIQLIFSPVFWRAKITQKLAQFLR